MTGTSALHAQAAALRARRSQTAQTTRQRVHEEAMRRYLDLYVPTRADADKPAERREPAPHHDAPVRRCEHPRQGEVRHEELLINGHHVSVTEDHVGVVELHEE